MDGTILIIIIVIFIVFITMIYTIGKKEKLRKYQKVSIGMSETEMLAIMGGGYNKSLLKNNRSKYEWRINATSSGYSSHGFSTRSYSGVHKVTIMVKDGLVEEVRPYNVD